MSDIFDIYVISLQRRTDRRAQILERFKRFDFCNIKFFNAIEHKHPELGCFLSHLSLIEFAKKNNMNYIIVIEDDARVLDTISNQEFKQILKTLANNYDKFETFNGAPSFWNKRYQINKIKKVKSPIKDFYFTSDCQSTAFMVYSKNFYNRALSIVPKPNMHIDVWLAENSMQLCYHKFISDQAPSYSDLAHKFIDMTEYFKNQNALYQRLPILEKS